MNRAQLDYQRDILLANLGARIGFGEELNEISQMIQAYGDYSYDLALHETQDELLAVQTSIREKERNRGFF